MSTTPSTATVLSPRTAGSIPSSELIKVCFSGQYTKEELLKFISSKGGLVAYLGTNSVIQVMERIEKGDQRAKKVLDAMCYNIVKQIGAMAGALSGKVQAILLTGGIAYNEPVVEYIREHCGFIAPSRSTRGKRTRGIGHERTGRTSGRHHPEGRPPKRGRSFFQLPAHDGDHLAESLQPEQRREQQVADGTRRDLGDQPQQVIAGNCRRREPHNGGHRRRHPQLEAAACGRNGRTTAA